MRFRTLLCAAALGLAATPPLQQGAWAQSQVLNLRDADIRAFIQDVARMTGRTFIIDPRVRGTVTVVTEEPLSRAELFDVFLSTLRANGLVAIPTGSGAYRIAPVEGAAQQSTAGAPGANRYVTEVLRLRSVDAQQALETVRPLIGPTGQVVASRRGNALIVVDFADNVRRIRALLGELDRPDPSAIQSVQLENSSAREIATAINRLVATRAEESRLQLSIVPIDSSNSVLLRGDPAAIAAVLPTIAELDRRAQAADDVQVVRLQYADAGQLLPVLQSLVGQTPTPPPVISRSRPVSRLRQASPEDLPPVPPEPEAQIATALGGGASGGNQRASIARYAGSNALIISADPETQRMLTNVIRQLDVRREQVLVEAIIVEISDAAARELGVQWLLAGEEGSNIPFSATNFTNTAPNLLAITGALLGEEALGEDADALDELREIAVDSLLGANGFLGGFAGRQGDAIFGFIINAVKRDIASNVLSTPSVLTLDNEEATILVGQEVPITTGEVLGDANTNPFRTIQRENVGVQLDVRPQITAGGTIKLFLRQEVSSIAGAVTTESPELILNTREIETTVSVDDGEILVLGGLIDQNDRISLEKVPLLGDIPLLGNLFRSEARSNERRTLMIFIRPTIIRGPEEATAVTARRYNFVRGEQVLRDKRGASSLDGLVREYFGVVPPAPAAPSTVVPTPRPTPTELPETTAVPGGPGQPGARP